MPWKIDDLDTPSVLIDLDRVEDNLRRAQDYADAHGLEARGRTSRPTRSPSWPAARSSWVR